jgi:hypothetical protein
MNFVDTPPHKCGRFAVLWGCRRTLSPKALPEPLAVLRGVVVPVQARATVRAGVPANGQTFLHDDPTAWPRAPLASERRMDRLHSLPSACCFEREDAQERAPPRIADALGESVVLEHVGRLQVFVIDRVSGADQGQRCVVVKVLPLGPAAGGVPSDAPSPAPSPLYACDCCPSFIGILCVGLS